MSIRYFAQEGPAQVLTRATNVFCDISISIAAIDKQFSTVHLKFSTSQSSSAICRGRP